MAQIPSLGIDNAVDALRKAKARGAKGVLISNWPSGGDEPLARRRPVLGRGGRRRACRSRSTSTSSAGSSAASGRKAAAKSGNQLYDMASEATRAKAIGGMSHVFSMAAGQHDRHDLHRRVRAVPRAAGVLDRDRCRLDPALPRVPRRPLVAQPRVGRPAAHRAAVVLLVPQQRGDRSSPTAPASSCATGSASTT